jgi:hypothetical protein
MIATGREKVFTLNLRKTFSKTMHGTTREE